MTATAKVSRSVAARIAARMAGAPQASASRGIAARLLAAAATISPSFGAARSVAAVARIAGRATLTARASAQRGLSARVFHRITASARLLIGTPDQRTFAVGAVNRTIKVAARAAISVAARVRNIKVTD